MLTEHHEIQSSLRRIVKIIVSKYNVRNIIQSTEHRMRRVQSAECRVYGGQVQRTEYNVQNAKYSMESWDLLGISDPRSPDSGSWYLLEISGPKIPDSGSWGLLGISDPRQPGPGSWDLFGSSSPRVPASGYWGLLEISDPRIPDSGSWDPLGI